jgi:hypothetical protein
MGDILGEFFLLKHLVTLVTAGLGVNQSNMYKFGPNCRGRCYDHNFPRISIIFGEKNGVFLKNQCYDQFFQNLALFWVKNANFFANFFGENI